MLSRPAYGAPWTWAASVECRVRLSGCPGQKLAFGGFEARKPARAFETAFESAFESAFEAAFIRQSRKMGCV